LKARIKKLTTWVKERLITKLPQLTVFEIIVLLLALGLYLYWASLITFDYTITSAPDERMRFMLPDYIFRYNRLPAGYDPEVIYRMGNWSYAYHPQWIGPILSAFFMNLASLIRESVLVFVFAARMTSVLAGVTAVFFVNRTLRILTRDERISLLGMALVAFWPQFAFLSSYINNDIITVAGISIMMYAVARSLDDSWTIKTSVILGLGMVVCLLSYLNSAGFVLAFGLYFLVSNAISIGKKHMDMKAFRRCFLAVFLVVAILWFPFLIRNALLYEGDFLGMNAFSAAMIEWEQNESMAWATENAWYWSYYHDVPWDENTVFEWARIWTHLVYRGGYFSGANPFEGNLIELLQDRSWRNTTVQSFITTIYFSLSGHFSRYVYAPYLVLMVMPILGLLRIKELKVKERYFILSCILGAIITVILFLYYNLHRDMQSQGRYLIAILPPLMIGASLGIDTILKRFTKLTENMKKILIYSGIICYIGLSLSIFWEFVKL
jgi:hypothetical protein